MKLKLSIFFSINGPRPNDTIKIKKDRRLRRPLKKLYIPTGELHLHGHLDPTSRWQWVSFIVQMGSHTRNIQKWISLFYFNEDKFIQRGITILIINLKWISWLLKLKKMTQILKIYIWIIFFYLYY